MTAVPVLKFITEPFKGFQSIFILFFLADSMRTQFRPNSFPERQAWSCQRSDHTHATKAHMHPDRPARFGGCTGGSGYVEASWRDVLWTNHSLWWLYTSHSAKYIYKSKNMLSSLHACLCESLCAFLVISKDVLQNYSNKSMLHSTTITTINYLWLALDLYNPKDFWDILSTSDFGQRAGDRPDRPQCLKKDVLWYAMASWHAPRMKQRMLPAVKHVSRIIGRFDVLYCKVSVQARKGQSREPAFWTLTMGSDSDIELVDVAESAHHRTPVRPWAWDVRCCTSQILDWYSNIFKPNQTIH